MKAIYKRWTQEFESDPEQQAKCAEDEDDDLMFQRNKRQKKAQGRKHGRFNLMIRRTYGTKAVAFLVIQMWRFNADLMDGIASTLRDDEGHALDDPPPDGPYVKWMKEVACKRHRAGHAVWRNVANNSVSWSQQSQEQRNLWYRFNDGTLTRARNEAAKKYGYGALFNEQEDVCMVLGEEQSFQQRSMDAHSGIHLVNAMLA